jgi:hypothetical protein
VLLGCRCQRRGRHNRLAHNNRRPLLDLFLDFRFRLSFNLDRLIDSLHCNTHVIAVGFMNGLFAASDPFQIDPLGRFHDILMATLAEPFQNRRLKPGTECGHVILDVLNAFGFALVNNDLAGNIQFLCK